MHSEKVYSIRKANKYFYIFIISHNISLKNNSLDSAGINYTKNKDSNTLAGVQSLDAIVSIVVGSGAAVFIKNMANSRDSAPKLTNTSI